MFVLSIDFTDAPCIRSISDFDGAATKHARLYISRAQAYQKITDQGAIHFLGKDLFGLILRFVKTTQWILV